MLAKLPPGRARVRPCVRAWVSASVCSCVGVIWTCGVELLCECARAHACVRACWGGGRERG